MVMAVVRRRQVKEVALTYGAYDMIIKIRESRG
jgi:hypothetical protein